MPTRYLTRGALFVLLLSPSSGLSQAQAPPRSVNADGRMTMALMGDAIITRRLSPYREPEFLRMIDLVRNADVAFTNLEMLLHDYEPVPASQSGGTYMRADPVMAQELVWAGIDMVNMANNHTGDYSADGARVTRRHAEAAGLVTAGAGEDLPEAREARFLETPAGRVALIGTSSSGSVQSQAGPPRAGVRGRPGMSMLRIVTPPRTVQRNQLETLRATLRDIGQPVSPVGQPLAFFGTTLVPGDQTAAPGPGVPHPDDMREIGEVVRNASQLADYVIVTIHAHSQAPYLRTFARAMIDAGADVFVGHGPHFLTGIEVYQGKPIFYSLGDFIFQNETLLRLPYDNYDSYGLGDDPTAWVADFNSRRYQNETTGFPVNREIWESVIATPTFDGKRLVSLELHPITLGFGLPAHVRGRPMLADKELGRKIINDLIERSGDYGTRIEWDEQRGIGVVRVTAPS
jgi:poly-gamma-glutamate synthesis protein (capsule biosynthesis protein)